MKLSIIFLLAVSLLAEDTAPNPELDAAKAKINLLEQTVSALQKKVQACFDIYSSDMTLNALAKQALATPSEPSSKAAEAKSK